MAFEIPEEIYQEWNAIEKGETSQNDWINVVSEYLDKFPEDYKEFMRLNSKFNTEGLF